MSPKRSMSETLHLGPFPTISPKRCTSLKTDQRKSYISRQFSTISARRDISETLHQQEIHHHIALDRHLGNPKTASSSRPHRPRDANHPRQTHGSPTLVGHVLLYLQEMHIAQEKRLGNLTSPIHPTSPIPQSPTQANKDS